MLIVEETIRKVENYEKICEHICLLKEKVKEYKKDINILIKQMTVEEYVTFCNESGYLDK